MKSTGFEGLRDRLEAAGFKKRAGDVFTREIAEDVLGWVGLNRATKHQPAGSAKLSPVVGVRHQRIERIVAELCGEKFHPYLPPTINVQLGYLMPERRSRCWVIEAGTDRNLSEVMTAIEDYAVPFMESAGSLRELCGLMDDRYFGYPHQLVYRKPVAQMLAGDERRALALADRAIEDLGERQDAAASKVRVFVESFRKLFGSGASS